MCPDKVSAERWLEVMEAAHEQGLFSTATIMFGHVDTPASWVTHWQRVIALQERTGLGAKVLDDHFLNVAVALVKPSDILQITHALFPRLPNAD